MREEGRTFWKWCWAKEADQSRFQVTSPVKPGWSVPYSNHTMTVGVARTHCEAS